MDKITALPAYGRDYKSIAAVRAAWAAGFDFRDARTGQYFSIRDNPSHVWVRYSKLTKQLRVA